MKFVERMTEFNKNSSIRVGSVQFGSIHIASCRFVSVRFNLVQFVSVRVGSHRFVSHRIDLIWFVLVCVKTMNIKIEE